MNLLIGHTYESYALQTILQTIWVIQFYMYKVVGWESESWWGVGLTEIIWQLCTSYIWWCGLLFMPLNFSNGCMIQSVLCI